MQHAYRDIVCSSLTGAEIAVLCHTFIALRVSSFSYPAMSEQLTFRRSWPATS